MSTENCNSTDGVEQAKVTVRVTAPDPYAGLKGHAYIKARNLNKPVRPVQTSAHFLPAGNGQVK